MPTSGDSKRTLEYQDTIDQIYEILQKYHSSHLIVIGGDLNEDLSTKPVNKRKGYLLDFINENNLHYTTDQRTFINAKGQDCSEIDYLLVDSRLNSNCKKRTLSNLTSNTSDHYPIVIAIPCSVRPKSITSE